MSTSIDDLLTTLDLESGRPGPKNPQDAALALDRCARMLTRLRDDLPETDQARTRDDFIRRLADACSQAAVAFDGAPGRLGDLVGVLSDATSLPGAGVSHEDRWAIAIRVATPARRFASAIAASGPFADVPQLLSVADRSRELLRAAVAVPPQLPELSGLDIPISCGIARRRETPNADIVEATARLAAEFRRYGRDPMTVRELVAISHASSLVAGYTDSFGRANADGGLVTSAWQNARDAIGMYSDGMAPVRANFATSRVISAALAVDRAVTRSARAQELAPAGAETEPLERARLGRLLQQIASHAVAEFERIGNRLFVFCGDRPLHEERVGEWLRHETFRARQPDLLPGIDALQSAFAASRDLVIENGREVSRCGMAMQRQADA